MKKPPPRPPAPPIPDTAFDDALSRGDRDRRRAQDAANSFRRRWDDAASQADRGDDGPYRMLAEAIRKLLRS